MTDAITEELKALHLAIINGRPGSAGRCAERAAELVRAARYVQPVSLPQPMEARHA